MIYLFYGENSFLLQKKLAELRARYWVKFGDGFNFWKLDLETELDQLENIVVAQSMFAQKKLAFLRGIFLVNTATWERIESVLKKAQAKNNQDIILIFYDLVGPDKKNAELAKKIKEFFKKNGQTEEFKNLERPQMLKWAGQEAQIVGLKISTADLTYLINSTGLDCWRILSEIDKLALLKNDSAVARRDIDEIVSKAVEANIFTTTTALAQKNIAAALKCLGEHWRNNEDPLMILNMLVWQFRSLIKTSDLVSQKLPFEIVAKKMGVKPWLAEKNIKTAKNFSLTQLKKIYQELAEADVAIKTGQKDGREALEDFVYSFLD